MTTRMTKLGLAEAAQKLGIPYQQAHRLVLIGALPGEKRAGRWYVSANAVRRLTKPKVPIRWRKTPNKEIQNGSE